MPTFTKKSNFGSQVSKSRLNGIETKQGLLKRKTSLVEVIRVYSDIKTDEQLMSHSLMPLKTCSVFRKVMTFFFNLNSICEPQF